MTPYDTFIHSHLMFLRCACDCRNLETEHKKCTPNYLCHDSIAALMPTDVGCFEIQTTVSVYATGGLGASCLAIYIKVNKAAHIDSTLL